MSDQIRSLAQGLFQKLQDNSFKIKEFNATKEQYLSNEARVSSYKTLSAVGPEANSEALNNLLTPEEQEVELELDFGPQLRDPCPDLPVFHSSTKESRNLTFTEDDPKVYLIDFWATWCGPCQAPMAHNQEMLEHNPQWEGKAEILCISLDDNTEAVNQRIEERKWDKVTSLWAGPKGFGEVAPRKFNVQGIPTCALVKNGKVLWIGHPSSRKLQDDINDLIEGKEITVGGAGEAGDDNEYHALNDEEFTSKFELARQKLKEFSEANPGFKAPEVVSVINHQITLTSETISQKFFVIGGFLNKFKDIGESFLNSILEIFPNAINRIRYEDSYTIERGSHCSLCSHVLDPAQTQYLCLFCDPLHYHCEECHNLPREGKGSAKLAHPHHLYKITKDASHLDELRFGKERIRPTAIYEEDPPSLVHRGVGCDNRNDSEDPCQGPVVGIRFKCAHCPDYDFCEKCESKWTTEPSQTMITDAKNRGHLPSHVFIVMHFP